MTDIQAIIDKLEAEKAQRLSESDKNYCDKVKSLNSLMHRVNEIDTVIHQLKKHLPKEDKSSFTLKTSDDDYILQGRAGTADYILELREILPDGASVTKPKILYIEKEKLPTVIAALQAMLWEQEGEDE